MRLNIATIIAATVTAGALALSSCGSIESIEGGSHHNSDTIVVGSQDYYSNEIIAEIYSQALEAKGYTVDRQFRIGQREVYVDEIESGRIDVFPEYTGHSFNTGNQTLKPARKQRCISSSKKHCLSTL